MTITERPHQAGPSRRGQPDSVRPGRSEWWAWLAHRPVHLSLAALAIGSGLLEAKNASIIRGVNGEGVALWTALTVNHSSQGLALAVAAVLAAFVAGSRRALGVEIVRRASGQTPTAALLDGLTVSVMVGTACVGARLLGLVVGVEASAWMADVHPPLVGPLGFIDAQLLIGDVVAVMVVAMLGGLAGAAARSAPTALAVVAPLAVLALDQLSTLLIRFPRLDDLASWLPAGLMVTALEGTPGRSPRAVLPPEGSRSPWIGVAGVALWFAMAALVARRQAPVDDTARATRQARHLASVGAAALVVGLVFPPLFDTHVPWRYQTAWLSARAEGRSSLDVVERFVALARQGRPEVRELLLPGRGADPLDDPFYAPIRDGRVVRVGPDSRMDDPGTVPVEVVAHEHSITYLFFMESTGDSWRVAQVQILQELDS